MIFFFLYVGSFNGIEEHLLPKSSHLVDEFFKLPMDVDGTTKSSPVYLTGRRSRSWL